MKKWTHTILLACCCAIAYSPLFAQTGLNTHNNYSTQSLVQDFFASGACNNIDLIQSIGSNSGIGYFENGADIIGIDNGIILSTGPTHHSNGPNNNTDTSGDFQDNSGDPDLNILATASLHDAVGVEFDFIPLDSFVSFRYVFASEEYCEFAGSQYNDVFGFFISGPGIEGNFTNQAQNLALVPGTNDYVSINTINASYNNEFYVHNELAEDADICGLDNINTPFLNDIEYDGFTSVLTAIVKVHPCETYHIRLVVGDVSDAFFDSAVFLEAESFNLGTEVSVEAFGPNAGDGFAYEGCEDAFFRFSRLEDQPSHHPVNIPYTVSNASTATANEDFVDFSYHIEMAAGQNYVDVPLRTLIDDLEEEPELIRLVIDQSCACYKDSADIYIIPPIALESHIEDTYSCAEQPFTINSSVAGGIAPYTYQWSSGGTEADEELSVTTDSDFTLSITDACHQTLIDTAQVYLVPPPSAFLALDTTICAGDTVWVDVQASGIAPFDVMYSINDQTPQWDTLNAENLFPITESGTHRLLSIKDAACSGLASGVAYVNLWNLLANINLTHPLCHNDNNGSIAINITEGLAPFEYRLNGQVVDSVIHSLGADIYQLNITDSRGCRLNNSLELIHPPALQMPVIDCDALAIDQYMPSALGGTPPYSYAINSDGWISDNWQEQITPGESVYLQIRDANNCSISDNWTYPIAYPDGMFDIAHEIEAILGVAAPLPIEWLINETEIAHIEWSPAQQLSCNDCLDPLLTAIDVEQISLSVENIYGCTQNIDIKVDIDDRLKVFIPNAFSPNGDMNNDVWQIFANPYQVEKIEELIIFDRWGNFVFQAKDWPINSERHVWDGTFNGQVLDPAVFLYSVRFKMVNGQTRLLSGSLNLVW